MNEALPEVVRPWGRERVLASGPGVQVKLIILEPGKSTPVAHHARRVEQWTILSGGGRVFHGWDPKRLTRLDLMTQNGFTLDHLEWYKVVAHGAGSAPMVALVVSFGQSLAEDDFEYAEPAAAGVPA